MIRFVASLMQSLRPVIIIGIALGFAAVYATYGWDGLWTVLKLVASGIVMNGAAFLVVLWAYRTWRTKRSNSGDIR